MFAVSRIAAAALLATALAGSAAWGQASDSDKAASRKKAEDLKAAIAACDEGASAPLDFTAIAAPVQFAELMPYDFNTANLKVLQSQCQLAWIGAPKEERLQLQWLRVTMALGDANLKLLTPQVRKLADAGGAEAQFLLYRLARANPDAAQSTVMEVSGDEARRALIASAEQGHMAAISELLMLYRGAYGSRKDLKQVVRWARRMESAPPQGIEITPFEDQLRGEMPMLIARTTLEGEGFQATETRAAFRLAEKVMKAGGENAREATIVVADALRIGRGARQDSRRARDILEALAKRTQPTPQLAEMLARGEGGPENGKRALAMVRSKGLSQNARARLVEAEILLAGKVVGYRPQEAIQILNAANETEAFIRLAGLLVDYKPRLDRPERIVAALSDSAASGNADAAMALARLKLSDNSQFTDEDGARALLKPLADAGNRAAFWLYASTQYRNLGSSSYRPMRREEGLSDAELMAAVDDGIRKEEAEAFLLKAKLLRAGLIYPQDDRGASDMLRQAAKGDNIEALLLLGDAYDEGLGISQDRKKRLEAWRQAAALGSLEAKSKISRGFVFDTFDRLMTLEEGVTWKIVLYNNGYGRSFSGLGIGGDELGAQMDLDVFSGRAMEAGTEAVAEAIMNGFRQAPAGLDDRNLVTMGKVFPQEIRVAIERRLSREKFFRGSPQGFWGPDARKALADWVEAKGFVPPVAAQRDENEPGARDEDGPISEAAVGRLWDKVRTDFEAAGNGRQKRAAIAKVNALAQYGNLDARWALLPNYYKADAVRRVVTVAEITRYGLDLMVEKPPAAEKVEFEFIFNTTQIYQDGKSREFGQAVLAAIRDDKRLQDPLVLGGILKQFMFAPGACDAVLASAKGAGVDTVGDEGCDEETLSALLTYAREAGPAGIDARNRKAAAEVLSKL
ncbi:tetratricopeptide repeat protein [Rhizobium sp.]